MDMDDDKCYATVRLMRWSDGVQCPHCQSPNVKKRGRDKTQRPRQRFHCRECRRDFDDLTGTIFAGHPRPLRVWMLCLYPMGLNLSQEPIMTAC
jgi:transposase-like protein